MAFAIHLSALLLASVSFASIKNITPKIDEIIDMKTALGIATIIQMPDTVQSAIIGDQSAYRIEYVDRAVTIKPLRGNAKTNLYLFTKERRYNLRLAVVPQNQAYYIVYIRKSGLGSMVKWTKMGQVASNADYQFKLLKIGHSADGFLLLNLSVTAKRSLKLEPSDFWLFQDRDSKVIQSLFLSKKSLKKHQTASVGISMKYSDLGNKGFVVDLRNGSKPLRLEVQKEALWK